MEMFCRVASRVMSSQCTMNGAHGGMYREGTLDALYEACDDTLEDAHDELLDRDCVCRARQQAFIAVRVGISAASNDKGAVPAYNARGSV